MATRASPPSLRYGLTGVAPASGAGADIRMIAVEPQPKGIGPEGFILWRCLMSTASFTTLIANVGRIGPTKTFDDDRQLASLSVAVSRKFKLKGETVEETDWYTVKTNLPYLINMIENHIKKGDQIIISGSQSHKVFERQNGDKGMAIEIFAHALQFNISKKPEAKDGTNQSGEPVNTEQDDDIPY
jgi:single-strand DNA-binding protein